MHTHGIGIDNVSACTSAQRDKPELLLQPAEQKADADAKQGTHQTDEATFEKKDLCDLVVGGTHIAQCRHVVLFVDNEHEK